MSCSTDWLKKAAFNDELINGLLLLPKETLDVKTQIVIDYLKSRVAEIDHKYK